jgi:O-antigen/teichoic acid export membrane protein
MQWTVTVYSAAVSLGLSVLFARSMGSSAFGHYTYIYVLASFLVLMQDAGFNTLLMRERTAPSAVLQSRYVELPSTALLHLIMTTLFFMIMTVQGGRAFRARCDLCLLRAQRQRVARTGRGP